MRIYMYKKGWWIASGTAYVNSFKLSKYKRFLFGAGTTPLKALLNALKS
jgi:hypothetical protein